MGGLWNRVHAAMFGSYKQSGSLGIKRITCQVQPRVFKTWVGGHFSVFFSELVGLPEFREMLCTPSLLALLRKCCTVAAMNTSHSYECTVEAGLDSVIYTGNGQEKGAGRDR